jgi:16S rRNA G966 N2-methylase RsmD
VSAVFVDRRKAAVETIRSNLEALGLSAAIRRQYALDFLETGFGEGGYALVFIDPPYDSAAGLAGSLARRLPNVLRDDAFIVTESDKRAPLELPFPLLRERSYGDTRIAVHRGT